VTGSSGANIDCIFCSTSEAGRDELILVRGRLCYVILNKYPYNNGHVMVAPARHVANLATMTGDEQVELMRLTRHAEMAITEAYTPQGINVGINLGLSAGAGIREHLHVHLVPRWNGDTNFISVVGDTRVLPEELHQSVTRLRPVFADVAKKNAEGR